MFSSQFHTHHLAYKIKQSKYITKFAYNYYTHLSYLYIKMVTKDTKCSEYNKNNKRYINIFWDSLDRVRNNTYKKLNTVLDDLETIQIHVYRLRYIFYFTKEHTK